MYLFSNSHKADGGFVVGLFRLGMLSRRFGMSVKSPLFITNITLSALNNPFSLIYSFQLPGPQLPALTLNISYLFLSFLPSNDVAMSSWSI